MPLAEVVIVGAARTPIGRYGGSLKNIHPADLGAAAAIAAMARAGIRPDTIDEVLIGHGRQAGSGPNPARQVGIRAGVPDSVPAQTINKACASGMQTIATGAQSIMLGEADVVLAGGIESMSRMPYLIDAEDARWGHKMGNFTLVDAMYRDGFTCSVCGMIMGETVEVLARQYGITREESDAYALESQQRAERAIAAGRFVDEITPVTLTAPGLKTRPASPTTLTADEHPRAGTTLESLRKLPLAFGEVEGATGIITAGAASGVTDGGAAVVLMSAAAAKARGVTPLARIIGWASAGVDPRLMGIGPVPAVKKLLARTGLTLEDFDLVELNEAFAAQVLAVLKDLPIPMDKLNVNGGAIALGHPIGCTGTRIVVTLLYEMMRRKARRGLATLCVSGGMGMAMGIELC
ncbi:MAG TPA: acetyl-CoA C-acetyltransferase, partial [Vicinamibacterales bacterium]|nr:acetyl-CoA C-acetyltransferase [Vicinamibacterales bacterium]